MARDDHAPPLPALARRDASLPPLWIAALLWIATVALYAPVRNHDFVAYDDPEYVTANPLVQSGLSWSSIRAAFTTAQASNWHPITWISHQLDRELFGPGPRGPHLLNALLHAANAALLFILLHRITGTRWRSLLAAAAFACHPLHVESVAWISERKDVLSGVFFLLTLLAYAHYVRAPGRTLRRTWYAAALLLFAAGLMSKPMLVTLPCLLLLLDFWPLRRWPRAPGFSTLGPLLLEKLPFLALSAASAVITVVVQQEGGAVKSLQTFPLVDRLANAVVSYPRYIGLVFWPADLACFYPHPRGTSPLAVGLALLALVGLSGLAWRLRHTRPAFIVGWCWFVGLLVPVIGLIQVGGQSHADRYMYLPAIGLYLAASALAAELAARRSFRLLVPASAVVALVAAAIVTSRQLPHWRNTETLFRRALAVTADNHVAHNNLANVLLERGEVASAFYHYEAALAIEPRYADAHNNLGTALADLGHFAEALQHLEQARALSPRDSSPLNNLGNVYLRQGHPQEALGWYLQALELQPLHPTFHNNVGWAYRLNGDNEMAEEHLRHAVALDPDYVTARANLGSLLLERGQIEAALAHLNRLLQLFPHSAAAHNHLGTLFLEHGQLTLARAQFDQALALDPKSPEVLNNLGNLHLQAGDVSAALACYEQVLAILPENASARYNYGNALYQAGLTLAAVTQLERAVALDPDQPAFRQNLAEAVRAATSSATSLPSPPTAPTPAATF
jgi:protein O-mannosyl-transferase